MSNVEQDVSRDSPPAGLPAKAGADERGEERANEALAVMKPSFRHSLVGGTLAHNTTGFEAMDWKDTMTAYDAAAADIATGDLSRASNMLTSQALTLDAVFTELLSRATRNMGQYPEAVERYMRLALKAQAQSRASIETLMKMHQPREQTVRHIHVGPDGQAVFIENLHGGLGNVRSAEQPHAQGASGPPLLGNNASGHGVPITGSGRETSMPDARGRGRERRTARQS